MALAQQPVRKKVYISVDLEGISGVASETCSASRIENTIAGGN